MSQPPKDPTPSPSPSRLSPETTDTAVVDLEEVLRPRTSRRRRAIQAGSVLALLLVVVGVLLHGVALSLLGGTSGASRGTPASNTSSSVLITSNVSFGTVTINGKTLSGSPPLLVTHVFYEGSNLITLSAPPFQPHSCTVGWFNGQLTEGSGTGCGAGINSSQAAYRIHGVLVTPDYSFVILVDSADLPSDLAAQAYATAAQALAATSLHTVVPSGQYYATGTDSQDHLLAHQAATPLQAEVLFAVPPSQSGPTGAATPCGSSMLCASLPFDPDITLPTGQKIWSVGTTFIATWRYTSPSGTVTMSPTLLSQTLPQLLLTYDPSTRAWRIFAQPQPQPPATGSIGTTGTPGPTGGASPGLPTLSDQLTAGLCGMGAGQVYEQALVQGQTSDVTSVSQDKGVAGCEIQVLTGSSSTVQGTFLWRFGVLLAVDKGAHTLAPWLPLAPPAEIAAAGG